MIDRQGGKLLVECVSCDAVLDTETDDFNECREIMKREEWKVRKIAGGSATALSHWKQRMRFALSRLDCCEGLVP